MNKNSKCSGCKCYWKPTEDDIKTDGTYYELCKKCSDYKKNSNTKCIEEGCKTRPLFNYEGQSKGLYCSLHKKDGMTDVIHSKCIEEGCKKQSSFNYEGQSKGLYCSLHKKDGMTDVIHSKCIEEGCKIIPYFNYEGQSKGLYCSLHKKDGMTDVKNSKCIEEGCKIIPYFNYEGQSKGLYCSLHKKDGMTDVKSNKCISPLCDKYQQIDKYCARCFYALNPNDIRCKRIKMKENEVIKYIQDNLQGLDFIYDTPIKGDGLCYNIRPDILLNLNHHSIIIEIDENQHKFYNKECDQARTNKLQEALNRPITIIRFNPDEYIDKTNTKINGCFKIDKKLGLTTIPKKEEKNWINRLEYLKRTILENINNTSFEPITIIKLFYDNQ